MDFRATGPMLLPAASSTGAPTACHHLRYTAGAVRPQPCQASRGAAIAIDRRTEGRGPPARQVTVPPCLNSLRNYDVSESTISRSLTVPRPSAVLMRLFPLPV